LELVQQCDPEGRGYISHQAFHNLFYSAVSQGGIDLTASLSGRLRDKSGENRTLVKKTNFAEDEDYLLDIIKEGELEGLKQYISKSKDIKKIIFNGPQITGGNLLHHSCRMAQFEMIKFLVEEKEFDVNSQDVIGTQPLYLACCAQIVSWKKTQPHPTLQLMEEPLEYKKNRRKVVKFLLKNGANTNSKGSSIDKRIIYSPIFAAAHTDDLKLVKILVEEANLPLSLGISPLFNAIIAARVEMVMYFLEKIKQNELDSDSRDMYGRTPQEYAKLEYDDELAETQCGGGKGTLERNQEICTLLSNLDSESHTKISPLIIPILSTPLLLFNDDSHSLKTNTTDSSEIPIELPPTPVSAGRSVKTNGTKLMNRSKSEKTSKREKNKRRESNTRRALITPRRGDGKPSRAENETPTKRERKSERRIRDHTPEKKTVITDNTDIVQQPS